MCYFTVSVFKVKYVVKFLLDAAAGQFLLGFFCTFYDEYLYILVLLLSLKGQFINKAKTHIICLYVCSVLEASAVAISAFSPT